MGRRRPESYVDTCVLVSLFHGDGGYGAAEAWLISAADQVIWISHWVLLEFASATAVRLRRGDLALAHRQGLRLVSADKLLVSVAHSLGIEAELVA